MSRALTWLKQNLFGRPIDILITVSVVLLLLKIIPSLLTWFIFQADFVGTTSSDCSSNGACWVFIKERFGQLMFGFYDEEQRWRPIAALLLFCGAIFGISRLSGKGLILGLLGLVASLGLLVWGLISGGILGLPIVGTDRWGGLMLTLIVASVGILASLPLGVLLALGRRSSLPVIKYLCIGFIEFWRGIPLITVLFMASVMLPLFLPEGISFDKLLRCLIGVALFSSAYMAEVVRGGLQALPRGQYEAAEALGLNYWQGMFFVILPQALKKVIPGIVNTFIGLFKDTTLVLIVGLFDLLGVVQASMTDPDWLGYSLEGYVFAALVFWVFCFAMSQYSQKIERHLSRDTNPI